MAVRPRTTVSLFSGIGALDLAIGRVFPDARCLIYVEREIPAVATLAARMEAGDLDAAPVWSDVRTVPTDALRGRVDMVAGGFPCQDISLAGKGAGIEGERSGLFFDLMRLVRDVRPRYVFLENVAAITVRGLDAVLGTLAESGFDAEWACLKASDVGAPHGRDRWWCLAWDWEQLADCHGHESSANGRSPYPWSNRWHHVGGRSTPVADAECCGHDGRAPEPLRRPPERVAAARTGEAVGGPGFPPGPSDRDGWRDYLDRYPDLAPATERAVRGGAYGAAAGLDVSLRRAAVDEIGSRESCCQEGCAEGQPDAPLRNMRGNQERPAPPSGLSAADVRNVPVPSAPHRCSQERRDMGIGQQSASGLRGVRHQFSAEGSEGIEDLPISGMSPGVGAPKFPEAVGCACNRVDRLRGLGNAVVPQQAEAALRALWFRAFGEWP